MQIPGKPGRYLFLDTLDRHTGLLIVKSRQDQLTANSELVFRITH